MVTHIAKARGAARLIAIKEGAMVNLSVVCLTICFLVFTKSADEYVVEVALVSGFERYAAVASSSSSMRRALWLKDRQTLSRFLHHTWD